MGIDLVEHYNTLLDSSSRSPGRQLALASAAANLDAQIMIANKPLMGRTFWPTLKEVERRGGKQLLQSGVLLLQFLEPLGIKRAHAAEPAASKSAPSVRFILEVVVFAPARVRTVAAKLQSVVLVLFVVGVRAG